LTHIYSVIFARAISIVTMHDLTTFPKQVVSVTLSSVTYNNNGGSTNKYDCQFLKCIYYAYERNFKDKFLFYR